MNNLTSSEWAAWIQAIGSVGAIIAAIFVMHSQHNQSKKFIRQNEQRRISALRAVVMHTAFGVEQTIAAISTANKDDLGLILKVRAGLMTDVIRPIQAIPMHELASFDLVGSVYMIDALARQVANTIDSLQKKVDDHTLDINEVKTVMGTYERVLPDRKSAFNNALAKLLNDLQQP